MEGGQSVIPLIAFCFSSLNRVQGSLDESRFTALSWPNFTRVVVIGQGVLAALPDPSALKRSELDGPKKTEVFQQPCGRLVRGLRASPDPALFCG